LLLAGLLKPSYLPAKTQRELRDLTRYRVKLIQQIASEKNRIIRFLEESNVKLSSVLSDILGIVATKLINLLCEGKSITMTDIDNVYHHKLQCTKEELYEACNGVMSENTIMLLGIIRKNIAHTQTLIESINQRIKSCLSEY
jgi:hypothetical protein